MPIQTDLSVSPYFDDFSEDKNFYKVLFKPSVAVQVRELNQLQTILQAQVEKFGDAVFKRGTIIDGCNFTFLDSLKYARIKDNQVDGTPVNVSTFKNMYVRDSDNLIAYIVETDSGFESRSPDLNTIYLRYINSGDSYSKNQFDKNSILTVYDSKYSISRALVNEGSTGFSNNDTLVVYPAIAVQNSTGGSYFAPNTWVVNTRVVQDTTGAEAEILEVNATANSQALVLKVRPLETDLDDSPFNANNWNIVGGYTITGANLGATTANASANGLVVATVGAGAAGTLLTDGTGKITQVAISAGGEGYYVAPHITVASPTGAIESANIQGYNYLAQVTVQNDDTGIGNSYGVEVSDGILYQKGHFTRVQNQLIIAEKYANTTTPHEKVVGFDTQESIVTSDDDQSLLDNGLGTFNYTAPGADRVKLVPTLVVLDKGEAEANTDFLPLVEFSRGKPYKQLRNTQFNKIGVELAQRTYEESGNYVIDRFQSTTVDTSEDRSQSFDVVIDPGTAYILGNRVQSVLDYTETLPKGTAVTTVANTSIDTNYGYYIRVNELGGYFKFNTGDVISLRSAALQYASNTALAGTQPAAPGTEIGQARMKVITYESGEPGSSAVYRIYLWDVVMNTGKNFADVQSVYYDGTTYKGYADIVLDSGKAVIYDNSAGQLIFRTGYNAVKTANSISYTYRSVNATSVANTLGVVNTSPVTGTWKYSGELTTAEKSELIVTPLASMETANVSTANVGASNTVIGLANATFGAALRVGDYIKIKSGSDYIRKITGITNSTILTIDSVIGVTNTAANVSFVLPKYTPIQLSTRPDRSANVNGSYLRIYINPPAAFTSAADFAVSYNAERTALAPTTKNTFRNKFVKLNLATNAANTVGPWYLGVPDIFRLRGVYVSSSSSVNTNSTNITNEFFVDHAQNENSYNGGYLVKKPASTYTLTSSDYLLVQYDAFDKTGGIYTIDSYNLDDTANLATLSATSTDINTMEIPEMYTSRGEYFDLRDNIDFRVSSTAEANIVSTATDVNITTNPVPAAYADRYNDSDEKYFPLPQGDLSFNLEAYVGRTDRIVVNANGDFVSLLGDPGKVIPPDEPTDALTINILTVPPYPSLPTNKAGETIEILDSKVANIKYTNKREKEYSIVENISQGNIIFEQPVAYKMTDIASIDRRLKNIEYRIDLKDIEDGVKNLNIPSSVDAAMERFKFGFFVDNFTSTDFSDLDDVEYSAMNFNCRITPKKAQVNVKHKFYTANATTAAAVTGNMLLLPYEEYSLIKQLNATATLSQANTQTSQTTAVYEYITPSSIASAFNRGTTDSEPNISFTFSATAGPVSLYITPKGKDRYEVYQSTTPGFVPSPANLLITSESGVNMTADEVNRLSAAKAYGGTVTKAALTGPLTFESKSGNPKYWVKGSGKITWTHNPSRGRYYTVVVKKGTPWVWWRLEYPVDASVTPYVPSSKPTKAKYKGKATLVEPKKFQIVGRVHDILGKNGYITKAAGSSNKDVKGKIEIDSKGNAKIKGASKNTKLTISDASAGPCKIRIELSGLRPLTKHNFYINKDLANSKAMAKSGPQAGTFGTNTVTTSSLITDAEGKMKVEVYFDNDFPDSITETEYSQLQELIKGIKADRKFEFKSEDGQSRAKVRVKIDVVLESNNN